MRRIRSYFADLREGARILASRDYWRGFLDYWSPAAISKRLDDLAERIRRNS